MLRKKLSGEGKDIFTYIEEISQKQSLIDLTKVQFKSAFNEQLANKVKNFLTWEYSNYAHVDGYPNLRATISDLIQKMSGQYYSPETEITITAGVAQTISTAISSLLSEGDEVVIFEPTYSSYISIVEQNGGKPVFVQMKHPHYHIDWDEVGKIINPRTRIILINTPHNPTGYIFNQEDYGQLRKLVNGTRIVVISDESFQDIVFDDNHSKSLMNDDVLRSKSIVVSSFSRSFGIPGWKVGYCLAPENLMKEYRKKQFFQIHSVNKPFQHAINEFLTEKQTLTRKENIYCNNRELVVTLLKNAPLKIVPTRSTYFQLIDYSQVSDLTDIEFVTGLIDERSTALFPMSMFYHDGIDHKMIGLCFANETSILKKGIQNIISFVENRRQE